MLILVNLCLLIAARANVNAGNKGFSQRVLILSILITLGILVQSLYLAISLL